VEPLGCDREEGVTPCDSNLSKEPANQRFKSGMSIARKVMCGNVFGNRATADLLRRCPIPPITIFPTERRHQEEKGLTI
jgi:hypothetical protein